MAKRDPNLELALDVTRRLVADVQERTRRKRKRAQRIFKKLLRTFVWLFGSTVVIITAMISTGKLFGPRGVEGLLMLPLLLVGTWSAIVYFSFLRGRTSVRALPKADIKQLPGATEEWLEGQRHALPASTRDTVEQILQRLEMLTLQMEGLDAQSSSAFEMKRLIGEELPELVRNYQKVPRSLRSQEAHGGKTPDRQIAEGLATIDEQMEQLQARIASDDMKALATQQRYLEMKYKGDKRLE